MVSALVGDAAIIPHQGDAMILVADGYDIDSRYAAENARVDLASIPNDSYIFYRVVQ
jgi:hypothetical protein